MKSFVLSFRSPVANIFEVKKSLNQKQETIRETDLTKIENEIHNDPIMNKEVKMRQMK